MHTSSNPSEQASRSNQAHIQSLHVLHFLKSSENVSTSSRAFQVRSFRNGWKYRPRLIQTFCSLTLVLSKNKQRIYAKTIVQQKLARHLPSFTLSRNIGTFFRPFPVCRASKNFQIVKTLKKTEELNIMYNNILQKSRDPQLAHHTIVKHIIRL